MITHHDVRDDFNQSPVRHRSSSGSTRREVLIVNGALFQHVPLEAGQVAWKRLRGGETRGENGSKGEQIFTIFNF